MRRLKLCVLVALYLSAVVAANEVIATYGKAAVLYVALGLVAFTLVARDQLHDLFGQHRLSKMAVLIGAGAVLSYVLNADAKTIAVASAAAFAASESVDAVAYHLLRLRPWLERSNASNVVSASVDTVVFFWVAFGVVPPLAMAQAACKVAGGVVYSLLMQRRRDAVLPRHA